MPTTVLLDGNIYDRLDVDAEARGLLSRRIASGHVRVIATPVVVDELGNSPFGGLPGWFPIEIEAESVAVLGHWGLGMARLGGGSTYTAHRGESNKIPDAIIADSAESLAGILVSEDRRCRKRLADISRRCSAMNYEQFRAWLSALPSDNTAAI